MRKQFAKLLSTTVRVIAESSADKNSDWKFFQPKVPAKLKKISK